MVKIIDLNLKTPNEIISASAIVITAMSKDAKYNVRRNEHNSPFTTKRKREKEKGVEISEGIKVKCGRLLKMNRKYEGRKSHANYKRNSETTHPTENTNKEI